MNRHLNRRSLLGLAALGAAGLALPACTATPRPVTPAAPQALASSFSGDIAVQWSKHFRAIIAANGLPAPTNAQTAAELGVVLFLAARPGLPGARPLSEHGDGALRDLPNVELGTDLHLGQVANAALAHLTLRRYVDSAGPILATAIKESESYAAAIAPPLRERSTEAGTRLGQAVYDWYLNRMVQRPDQMVAIPVVSATGAGRWVSTPPDLEEAVLPYWGMSPTLMLRDGAEMEAPAPAPYSEEPGSPFRTNMEEVYRTVAEATPEHAAIAKHWSDGKWTDSPPGHWLGIAEAELDRRDVDLAVAAEALLRVGVAQHDAFVSCWYTKYKYYTVRPITYIRNVLGVQDWLSPVATPCFPEYTSGHATQAAAAATALSSVLGDGPFTDHTRGEAMGLPPRSYPSFTAAAEESAVSRLYGGIHVREANVNGASCGLMIGQRAAALPLLA